MTALDGGSRYINPVPRSVRFCDRLVLHYEAFEMSVNFLSPGGMKESRLA